MGNRAVITTKADFENNGIGIYLHWNGGFDSVSAFLEYCNLKGYRKPEEDCYGYARMCQVIGNFFGGSTSIGINTVNKLDCDNWDNGVYIIENWKIVDRKFFDGHEQTNYNLQEMLLAIDEAMPTKEQLGADFLKAREVPVSELEIGDIVFIMAYDGEINKHKVVGFGENGFVNGTNVLGIPYVDLYGNADKGYNWNINNYILTDTVRVAVKAEANSSA